MNARVLALALLLTAGAVSAEVPVPALTARVTDLTGTLDEGQRAALEARLAAFERAKGSEIAVLVLATTQPEDIAQYSIRVADQWKVGRRRGIDDGVILVVAVQDRAVRIEVGDGLEGVLPDAIANRITDEVMVPRFREHDYYGGISDGVERIIQVIEGEPLPAPSERPRGLTGPSVENLWLFLLAPLAVGTMIRRMLNRVIGAFAAAFVAGALGWWWTRQLAMGAVFALICGFLILVANQGRRGRWSSGGGSWGGGGYSGGGGGGWSGGGGHFSGGGATGRW